MKGNPVLHNAAWIIGCRVIQSVLQLVVGMLCARYLGPANYGLLSYAGAMAAFALPLMRLGLNETLVRELTDHPGQDGEIMGTALILNLLSGVVCMGMVAGAAAALHPGDRLTVLVCFLYSLSLLTGALEMIRYWFQCRLLASGKSVCWFALTGALDYGIIGVFLLWLFYRQGCRLRFSAHRAGALLAGSHAYIGAGLMVVLFQNTDRIMLASMAGSQETGLYTAAVTCVTMGQFVYVALVDSARPVLLRCREKQDQFRNRMRWLYGAVVYLAVLQGVAFTLGAPWIIAFLYGDAYSGAVPVLRVLNGYFVFSCMGLVRNVWILAHRKQHWLWLLNLAGAVVNVLLNLWWIPRAGAVGAAAASLVTQLFANLLMGWLLRPLRENNVLLLRGLNPVFLLEAGKGSRVNRKKERKGRRWDG